MKGPEITKKICEEIEDVTSGCFYDGRGFGAESILEKYLDDKIIVTEEEYDRKEEKWLRVKELIDMIEKQMDRIKFDIKGKKMPVQLWYEDLKDKIGELKELVRDG